MTADDLSQRISVLSHRLESIQAEFISEPAKAPEILSDALESLHYSLENLLVAEKMLKRKNEEYIESAEGSTDALTMMHSLQVHQIELEMQNEELRRVQAELSVSKSKYQDLYEFAPIGYLTLDGSGKILEANLTSESLLGTERVHLVNNRFQAYLDKNCILEFNSFCSRVLESGKRHAAEFELNYTIKNREVHRWVLLEAQPMRGDICRGFKMAVIDITERKKAKEALQKSEERYRTLFNSAADAIVIHDFEGHFLEVNDQTVMRLGYSKDELLGLTPEDIDCPESALKVKCRIDEILHKGFGIFESVNKTKDGRLLPAEVHAHLIEYEGKKAILAIWRDISERKQAMKEIESLARFPDENPNPVLRITADGTIAYSNCCSAPLLELWGCQVGQRLPEDFKNLVLESLGSGKLNKIEVVSGGRLFSLDIVPIPELDYVNIYGRDITESRRAKVALQESESKFRETVAHLDEGYYRVTPDGLLLDHNPAFNQILSIDISKDMKGAKLPDFWQNPDERIKYLNELMSKGFISNYLINAKTFSNEKIVVLANSHLVKDEMGRVLEIEGTFTDFTERKRAEEALEAEKDRAEQYLNTVEVILVALDAEARITLLNRKGYLVLGYEEGELTGRDWIKTCLRPQDHEAVHEVNRKIIAGEIEQFEYYEGYILNKNGEERSIAWHTTIIKDEEGCIIGTLSSGEDITERKKAEDALRDSESKLAAIIEFLPDATLVIDNNKTVIAWNRVMEELTGIKAQDILGKEDYEYALPFYGERRPILVDLVLEPESEIEKRYFDLKRSDGTIVGHIFTPKLKGVGAYLWGVASPIYDIQGKIVGAIESIKDITEQKRMEKDLQESKDYLNKIINSIGDPLFVEDRQHRMTLVNDAACRLFGRPRGDLLGKTASDLFPSREMVEISWKTDEVVFNKGIEVTNEETNTYADKTLTVLVKKTPYTDHAGNQFLVGITRDITDRKQAEDKIIASLKEKEVLLREVHHRVKNNLQIISALLSLQSSCLDDEDLIKIFRDSQNRIKSMALVHENLYRSKDFGKVDFNEYLGQLASHLSQSYGNLAGKINFKVNSENVYLNINIAIPCGMIINELVSNSFKHAFPDGRNGEVCIDLSSEDDNFTLVVSDNGAGIKEDLNIKDSKTLGFRLIDTLVKQIDGKMRLDTINGTKCEIHFKGLK